MTSAFDWIGHPEFDAFIAAWKATGNCPVPFADWLGENVSESHMLAAIEAYTVVLPSDFEYGGHRPVIEDGGGIIEWWWLIATTSEPYRSHLRNTLWERLKRYKEKLDTRKTYDNYAVAIADFLDAAAGEISER